MGNEFEIKTKEGNMEGLNHEHPSFGMVSVSQMQGGVRLFGSEVSVSSFIKLSISHANVTQDLGSNWYSTSESITEVWMTPVQYAEMISSPNTQGVPCTIRHTQKLGTIVQAHIDTVTEFSQSELEKKASDIKQQARNIKIKVDEILSKKGAFKKSDKESIAALIHELSQGVASNFGFYEKCVHENIERAKMEAKSEIEHHITHAISKAGVAALQDPEIARLAFKTTSIK